MEPDDRNRSESQRKILDRRLACLRTAILEDWDGLEAEEENGSLVIRVKEPVKHDHLAQAADYKQTQKQRKPDSCPERGLVGVQ